MTFRQSLMKRQNLYLCAVAVLLLVFMTVNVLVGSVTIPFSEMIDILLNH